MKYIIYEEGQDKYILPICESCLTGKHLSYGDDHRSGENGRTDCKNTENLGDKVVQCMCNPEWPELYDKIEKGIEKVYDDEKSAEKAKIAKLEIIAMKEGK